MVLGTIYAGIASVSEAAGMGVVGVLISALVRRELNWPMLRDSLRQTMVTCGTLLWISFGATAMIGVYNVMGGMFVRQELFTGLPLAPRRDRTDMMLILIVLGMFMDWVGILLLTMPIFVPIVVGFGMDPVWFGILFCMSMQVSYLSPPFGPAAFYLKGVAPPDISLQQIFNAFWPFIALQIVGLAIVCFNPGITLWLPQLINGRLTEDDDGIQERRFCTRSAQPAADRDGAARRAAAGRCAGADARQRALPHRPRGDRGFARLSDAHRAGPRGRGCRRGGRARRDAGRARRSRRLLVEPELRPLLLLRPRPADPVRAVHAASSRRAGCSTAASGWD